MNSMKAKIVGALFVVVSAGACDLFRSKSDESAGSVTPAQGGSTATGGTSAGGGPAHVGGGGGTPQGGSGGTSATGTSCAGLAGPEMVEVTAPNGTKFCIDRTEVTQGQYAAFLKAASSKPGSEHSKCGDNVSYEPKINASGGPSWEPGSTECVYGVAWTPETTPNRPVSCIDWCDAYAFCAWAGKRLCGKIGGGSGTASTTALDPADSAIDAASSQWYSACSQGGKTLYPYGNTFDKQACEGYESATLTGAGVVKDDVGANPTCRGTSEPYASIVDLSGSLAEFTNECALDTTSPGSVTVCAARGGGYSSQGTGLDCKHYGGFSLGRAEQWVGFRCCKDAD